MQDRCIYLGEGKKIYVLTKHVKKIHFCLFWGFSNHSSNQGGKWVGFYCDFSVDSFYCDILLNICQM